MDVNLRKLILLFVLVAVIGHSRSLHLLPSVIEHFHQSDPEEAKRISHFLTQSDAKSNLLSQNRLSRAVKHPNDLASRHKISASLLHFKAFGNKVAPTRRLGLDSNHNSRLAETTKRSGPLRHNRSLVGKPISSDAAKRRLAADERKLIFAATDEHGETINMTFETTEIKDALDFIEFKISELNTLMTECINQQFESTIITNAKKVKDECVGTIFQVLYYNYREGMSKVKDILMELLKIKLQSLKEDYEDETNFFLDIIENLIDKDYDVFQSLDIAKKASKYYVSPRYFEKLIELARPELEAFETIHQRLKTARNDIQKLLDNLQNQDDQYLNQLEAQAEELDEQPSIASNESMQKLFAQMQPQSSPNYDYEGSEDTDDAYNDEQYTDQNYSEPMDGEAGYNDEDSLASEEGNGGAGEDSEGGSADESDGGNGGEGGEGSEGEAAEGASSGERDSAEGGSPAEGGSAAEGGAAAEGGSASAEEGRRLARGFFGQSFNPPSKFNFGYNAPSGVGMNNYRPSQYQGLGSQGNALGGYPAQGWGSPMGYQNTVGIPQASLGQLTGGNPNYQGIGYPGSDYTNVGLRKSIL